MENLPAEVFLVDGLGVSEAAEEALDADDEPVCVALDVCCRSDAAELPVAALLVLALAADALALEELDEAVLLSLAGVARPSTSSAYC